ncbi:MAG: PIG-L deacetylase family protein [Pseudomonadota bacterium]
MLSLPLKKSSDDPINVLCLGAHCDDIEIGCGGTILNLKSRYSRLNVFWQVFTSTPERAVEARRGAEAFCDGIEDLKINVLDFRDGFLPYHGESVKEAFEAIKPQFEPDLVLTHYRGDAHQDHRLVGELTWNTFRNHLILEYEIPKWDGDLGRPNCYIDLTEAQAETKIAMLQEVYNSQKSKRWFTDDLFHGLMRLRGMESNATSRLAEAFYANKLKID